MKLAFSAEEEAFRREVRRFFETEYPADILSKIREGRVLDRSDYDRSQQALHKRGWFAVGWPAEHGGSGWDATQRYIFDQELERAGAPWVQPMGVIYVGPVIYTFGTDEQRRRWLPGILDSTTFWAQGYSEPESGSDLASLRTRAELDGDHYVINGAKIWTSYAQWADWIFLLVRTSSGARKQEGITFICADMRTPGITVHPIISIDGVHHLNRVEFDNVRVPVENRIGDEGQGWHYATFLLRNERISYAHVARKREDLRTIARLAARTDRGDGTSLSADVAFQARLASLEMEVDVLDIAVLRLLTEGGNAAPAQASALKIAATELAQGISELFVELAGPAALIAPDRHVDDWWDGLTDLQRAMPPGIANYMFDRAQTIFGGTTEVQKGIIWKEIGR